MTELVTALRSGKYMQGYKQLRSAIPLDGEHEYCCLGVACLVAGKKFNDEGGDIRAWDAVMPDSVRDYFGFRTNGGMFEEAAVSIEALYRLNDSGAPFSKIADIIESKPPMMFV